MHRPVWAAAVVVTLAVALLVSIPGEAATAPRDYAAAAFSILPPGESGGLALGRNTGDQERLYDALTPLRGNVTEGDIRRLFKPAPLGLVQARPESVESPRRGLTISRDRFGVAHVSGRTQADVAFGAGWVTAADRGPLLQLLRGPARVAALDVPGVDPFALALSGKTFVPSRETEDVLANQIDALRAQGVVGRRILAIVDAYAAGINAWYARRGIAVRRFTRNDVVAAGALLGGRFGTSGGHEVANAMFLDALEKRLGTDEGRRVFADLAEANDPETPVTAAGSFPYETPSVETPGSVVIDDGSYTGAPPEQPALASNALLVGAKRSQSGHPLLVAGPQVGYFFPGLFAEMALTGGGFDTRGVAFPGVPFVLVGRGPDFAWSASSSTADDVDLFVETLCGGDDRHYLYRGRCLAMQRFLVGTVVANGQPDQPLAYLQTTHGPVVGYATVQGTKVAIAEQRSTRGRELLSLEPFYRLDTAQVRSAQDFVATISGVEFSFNWFYADDRHIAYFSSGRLPIRAGGTDPALPTVGTGDYDWKSFLLYVGHPRVIDPKSGVILNWNNRAAAGFGASDANASYGSVQRVQLLSAAVARRRKHTLASLVSAMNEAATQDLRVVRVWPAIRAVLATGPAPTARAQQAADLVDRWQAAGGSRLDRDLDGKIDAPGAAVLDAAWPALADAVLAPVLGPLVDRLAALIARSDDPSPSGSAYESGWYGYVDKDLRTLLGGPVRQPFSRLYCGAGALQACRDALWAALDDAAAKLEATQGADPAAWRSDANAERIRFASGLLADTMRWTNRPTFQQLMSFSDHRPR